MKLERKGRRGLWRASIASAALGWLGMVAAASQTIPVYDGHVAHERSTAPTLAFVPDLAEGYVGVAFRGGPPFGLCRIVVADKPDALLDLRMRLETGHGLPGGPTGFRAAVTCDLDDRGDVVWSLPEPVLFPGLYVQAYVLPVDGAERLFSDLITTGPPQGQSAAATTLRASVSTGVGAPGSSSGGVSGGVAGGSASQTGDMIVTEFMKDPAAVSDANGEWIELYNGSPHRQNVEGWVLSDDGSNAHLIYNQGQGVWVLPRRTLVLARSADPAANGLFFNPSYSYSGFTLSNGADEIVLTSRIGELSDRVAYDGTWPGTPGASVSLTPGSEDPTLNDDPAQWCTSSSLLWFGGTDLGTPGLPNDLCP